MSEDLKCPKCGVPLEKGYIQAPRGIYWDIKKHDWNVLSSEALISQFSSLTMPNEEAFRCPRCKLVLFTY